MDVRVGGRFRIRFATDDGETHEVGGAYRDVTPPQRPGVQLGVALDAGARVARHRDVAPDGDGTLLSLNHAQFFDQAARDGHERGWTGTLDKLEKIFA
jgi:Uncharacterized conserved protein